MTEGGAGTLPEEGSAALFAREVTSELRLDEFVLVRGMGFGKVNQVRSDAVVVEFFYSTGPDGRSLQEYPANRVRPQAPPVGQACRFRVDRRWRAGRISHINGLKVDVTDVDGVVRSLTSSDVFVRGAAAAPDPVEAIADGIVGHPSHAIARADWMHLDYQLRGAVRGLDGLASSRIELHPHQVEIVSRVLRDPLQRYLLADEVGLGKTIEAGAIARQHLIDRRESRVTVIAPGPLIGQWENEFVEKFAIDEFEPGRVQFWTHDPQTWGPASGELLIVDEAHHLVTAGEPSEFRSVTYQRLTALADEAEGLLLLSATPLLHNEAAFLGMLHLLDPALYSVDDLAGFTKRVQQKQELALRFAAFTPTADDYVLEEHADAFRRLFPEDEPLTVLLDSILADIDADRATGPAFEERVAATRVHIGETYRLHRRVLRTRRESSLGSSFPVRGRRGPVRLEVPRPEHDEIRQWLDGWLTSLAARLNDGQLDVPAQTVLRGLLDRLGVLPAIASAYVESWLTGTPDPTAELTAAEQHAIGAVELTPDERDRLADLAGILRAADAEGRWAELLIERLVDLPDKTTIFCGFTGAAEALARALGDAVGANQVVLFTGGPGSDEAFRRFADGPVRFLVGNASIEEGRNIQFAMALVHVHVPWDPNRLEQRIGRADRFGLGEPVPQYVVLGGHVDPWVSLLAHGFEVFTTSIATLQHVLEGSVAAALDLLVAEGPDAWTGFAAELRERLESERREIQQLENLESIEVESAFARSVFTELAEIESSAGEMERAIEGWVCGADGKTPGGLGLEGRTERGQVGVRSYRSTRQGSLPEEVVVEAFHPYLGKPSTVRRDLAAARIHLLRPGNTFYDAIRRFTDTEDLGQTFAMWRRASSEEPECIVSLHVRLEASALDAIDVLSPTLRVPQRATVQRLLDGMMPPTSHRIDLMLDGSPAPSRLVGKIDQRYNGRADEPVSSYHLARLEADLGEEWSEVWSRIGRIALDQAADATSCEERTAEALRAMAVASREVDQMLSLREKAETDPRHQDRLAEERADEAAMRSAMEHAIRSAKPRPESIGLFVFALWRPAELWPDDD